MPRLRKMEDCSQEALCGGYDIVIRHSEDKAYLQSTKIACRGSRHAIYLRYRWQSKSSVLRG